MIRILGAITGAALALATLLVVIGIPQFKTESTASEHAIVTLPLPTSPVEPGHSRTTATVEPAVADVDGAIGVDATVGGGTQPPSPDSQPDDNAVVTAGSAVDSVEPAATMERPAVELPLALDTPQSWYAFWSPFRSELAANGFVAQLQSVTGLDYRVVRVKPGVYEVAFAYEDDADITASLTQITAATGLELPQ